MARGAGAAKATAGRGKGDRPDPGILAQVPLTAEQGRALDDAAAAEGLSRTDFIRVAIGQRLGREKLFAPLKGRRPGLSVQAGRHGRGWLLRAWLPQVEADELNAASSALGTSAIGLTRRALAAFLGSDSAFAARARGAEAVAADLRQLTVQVRALGNNLNTLLTTLHLVRRGWRAAPEDGGARIETLAAEIDDLRVRIQDALRPRLDRPPPRAVRAAEAVRAASLALRVGTGRNASADALRLLDEAMAALSGGSAPGGAQ